MIILPGDREYSSTFQIFIADEPEVEALPRHRVAEYLEQLDKPTCVRYLEHIINELGEAGPDFHDKLAELYLGEARREWIKGNEGGRRNPIHFGSRH
jgi:hypothetical protein